MLAEARAGRRRPESPRQADAEIRAGALLVQIGCRPSGLTEGEVPGALVVERNVLEWRFDPASSSGPPLAGSYDLRVIIMCSQGYTSSLAAASLQDLGLANATDLAGGSRRGPQPACRSPADRRRRGDRRPRAAPAAVRRDGEASGMPGQPFCFAITDAGLDQAQLDVGRGVAARSRIRIRRQGRPGRRRTTALGPGSPGRLRACGQIRRPARRSAAGRPAARRPPTGTARGNGYQARVVFAQPAVEPLPRAGPQVQDDRRDVRRPRGCYLLHRRLELGGGVGQERDDRAHQHPAAQAVLGERGADPEPAVRRQRARLDRSPKLFVNRADRDVQPDVGDLGGLLQQFQVAQDQRALGQDRVRGRASRSSARMPGIRR